jgi:glycosyltransferase involved in cell wall biosynthesis
MRVIHAIPSLSRSTGGPAIALVEAALALRELDVVSTIVTTDMGGSVSATSHRRVEPADLPEGAEELDVRILPSRPPRRVAFSPAFYREVSMEMRSCSLAHLHMLWLFPHYAAFRAARRAGTPLIVSPCGSFDPHKRTRTRAAKAATNALWQKRLLKSASQLQYKSQGEMDAANDLLLPTPARVIPNGISWEMYRRAAGGQAFRRRYLGDNDGLLIVSIGRISHTKGLDVLIEAFARAAPKGHIHLVIAGPDDEGLTPRLCQIARTLQIQDRVHFVGSLNRSQKLRALAAADVWASASHAENFGTAVVEAMAAGRAVAVSSSVNLAHEIETHRAALIVDPRPEAFAEALGALLADSQLRMSLAERAREFAKRYDWRNVARELADMYREVAERGRRPARVEPLSIVAPSPK